MIHYYKRMFINNNQQVNNDNQQIINIQDQQNKRKILAENIRIAVSMIYHLQIHLLDIHLAIKILLSEYGTNIQLTNYEKEYCKKRLARFKKEKAPEFVALIEDLSNNSEILRGKKQEIIDKINHGTYTAHDLLNLKIYGGSTDNNKLVSIINNIILDFINDQISEIHSKYPAISNLEQDINEYNTTGEQYDVIVNQQISNQITNYSLATSSQNNNLNTLQDMKSNIDNNVKIARQELQRFQQMNNKLINFSHK